MSGTNQTSAELAQQLLDTLLRERTQANDEFREAKAAHEAGTISQEEYTAAFNKFDRAALAFHEYRDWHYKFFVKGTGGQP